MSEVMTTAQDNGIKLYYQDTDSMHIRDKDIKTLQQAFNKKYGRELIGKNLGQFHSDFNSNREEMKGKELKADVSIFLGKKCYIDRLRDKDGNIDYHIRMKGVSNDAIKAKCVELNIDPITLYLRLAEGERIEFDLCKDANNKPKGLIQNSKEGAQR